MRARWRHVWWLLGPLAALAFAIWWEAPGPRAGLRASLFPDSLVSRDPKARRTLASFDTTGVFERELEAVGGEGLRISIDLEPGEFERRLRKQNRKYLKYHWTNAFLRFGDTAPVPVTLRLRGNNSLEYGERLSFRVDLLRPQPFAAGFAMRRFFLMSMEGAQFHVRSRFGYEVFRDLGLYPAFVQYVRVEINGEPQGLYLLLEPPLEALRRLHPDLTGLHRRLRRERYRTYWVRDVPAALASIDGLRRVHRVRPEHPAAAYAPHLDLDAYYTYVAANTVLMNEDWMGELLLYERRSHAARPEALRPMAWDPEDVGTLQGKPGSVDDPLIFSGLDYIDFRLHDDPKMRAAYVEVLRRVLREELSPEYLSRTLREVVELRNSLDDGLPGAQQDAARVARTRAVQGFEARLLEHHAHLVAHLDKPVEGPR